MEAIEIIKIIGITSVPQILILVLLIFWGKRFIEFFFSNTIEIKKNELAQELEDHRQLLSQENQRLQLYLDKSLEDYKNKIEQLKLEANIQLFQLYSKRYSIMFPDLRAESRCF